MGDYWKCTEVACPFETNSGKLADKHEESTGHAVMSDDSEVF